MAKYTEGVITRSYREYVTESLRLIPQMMYLTRSWSDVTSRTSSEEGDGRSAEEIVDGVISRIEGVS